MILEKLEFCLRTHLGEIADAFKQPVDDKGLDLAVDFQGVKSVNVCGDPGALRQILVNLMSNAIKFTDAGEVVVAATLTGDLAAGYKLCCTVADTGRGMLEADRLQLFETLKRQDTSNDQQFGGAHFGLVIASQICGLMQGGIAIESELGRGSIFSFNVRLDAASEGIIEIPHVDLSQITVLIVDDDVENTQILRRELETWGAKVFAVADGLMALGFLEERCIAGESAVDIAFVCSQLKGMDSLKLGEIIRSDERYSNVKLLMMSVMSNRGDARNIAKVGFDAYFPKPATVLDIYQAISILIDAGAAKKQAEPLVTHHNMRDMGHFLSDALVEKNLYHILLVEDNVINQEVALGLIEEMGLTADVVMDGHEALASLVNPPNQRPYSLILMDCHMPVLDGYEATRKIRSGHSGEANKNIPIVAMTANAMRGDKAKCLDAGMSDYISKPVNPDELEKILCRWLKPEAEQPALIAQDSQVDPVWDKRSALRRLRGKDDRLLKIVGLFMADMPQQLTRLQLAIETENLAETRDIAHLIKGVAGNISGIGLSQAASEIQHACEEDAFDLVRTLGPSLAQEYSSLETRLKHYLDGPH